MHTQKMPKHIVSCIIDIIKDGFEHRTTIELFNQESDSTPPISLGERDVLFRRFNDKNMCGVYFGGEEPEWFRFYEKDEEIQQIPVWGSIRLFSKEVSDDVKHPINYNGAYLAILFLARA